jgi:hypothetical protein
VEKVPQKCGLLFYYQKAAQSKLSPNGRKFAQSGHPVFSLCSFEGMLRKMRLDIDFHEQEAASQSQLLWFRVARFF